jgi:ribosomal protein L11 methylase PrmA
LEHPPERLICSGLLVTEVDRVVDAFRPQGLALRERRAEGEWAAVHLSSVIADRAATIPS